MTSSPYGTEALEKRLSSGRSATAWLQDFCTTPLRVVQKSCDSFPLPEKLTLLTPSSDLQGKLSFRHIYLYDNDTLLLEAWNCFNPHLLPTLLQEKLTHSPTPFGALLGENFFIREALAFCQPSPIRPYILAHQALLRRRTDQQPLALVYEHYTQEAAQLCHKFSMT